MNNKIIKEAYTFDDLLLVPAYSKVVPASVTLQTRLTDKVMLNIPVCSAAMDTVTEEKMARALALAGGLGFIHKNMTVEEQARQVKSVKDTVIDSKLYPSAAVDADGKLIVAAAVGVTGDILDRVSALIEAGVNIVSVDSAHGHSIGVLDSVKKIRKAYPEIDIVGGNVVTAQAAIDLIYAGANCIKVGVGPGSICTTRVVAGVGVPQVTAVNDVYEVAKVYGIGVIADGGIKLSGDIVKALAAGGDCVMLGGLLAGCTESPGDVVNIDGKLMKTYVGMGSLSAMERGSSDRYFQGGKKELNKLVPEGIEASVPYIGDIDKLIHQLMGGLRSGMGYTGCKNVKHLKERAQFVKITNAGMQESHPHDVEHIVEAPNYHGK